MNGLMLMANSGFHSTDCPSEWGLWKITFLTVRLLPVVSIQLIAPASGAFSNLAFIASSNVDVTVSIQLIAPASGAKILDGDNHRLYLLVSIQLIAPASGALTEEDRWESFTSFHSTDCPSEWGQIYPRFICGCT